MMFRVINRAHLLPIVLVAILASPGLAESASEDSPVPPNPPDANQVFPAEPPADQKSADQVTSVSQLSDVQPTDWAFQALQSLVERYGCIVGYPDRTYRGNQAITRYEFAAGLNACLERIDELITAATGDLLRKEDLEILAKLQEEFAAELAALRGRVSALEYRTATLEKQQFSTTTKLSGEVIFGLTGTFGEQIADFGSDQVVFQDRVRLDLQTSFSGTDRLTTRLSAGNFLPPITPASLLPFVEQGTAEGRLSSSVGGNTQNQVILERLDYAFQVGSRLRVYVAAKGGRSSYYVPSTIAPFFDDFDGGQGALSAFAQGSPIYRIGGGAGLGVSVALDTARRFVFSAGYLARRANNPDQGNGLFNGDYAALAQLTLRPSSALQIGLTYVRGYHTPGNSIFGLDFEDEFFTGTVPANAIHTGLDVAATTNSYGAAIAYQISPNLVINLFGGFTDLQLADDTGEGEIWYYGLGLAFPDLFKKGNLGGILVGVEPYLGGFGVNGFNLRQLGLTNATSVHIEAFYRYQISDKISITPGFIWITAPEQFQDNDDYVIVLVRSTFSF